MANVNAEFVLIKIQFVNDTDPFSTSIAYLEPARGPVYSFSYHLPLAEQIPAVHRLLKAPQKVDECALQIYRFHESGQGDFGPYLDSDLSLAEQPDEVAILKEGRTSMVLRTNLCVRVHNIIEKMLNSTGRELRRALFSLKQIFQDDKDLVHEFVQNDGLSCLIKVGAEADQNYQNYILRALGQVMLYVDGMNGVIAHNDTIQWLYSLLASPFRLVVKTALKLLLVFVEYTESNSLLLLAAVYIVDKDKGALAWSKMMHLLNDKDNLDIELFIYTMTLINKTLHAIPDQDTFYDVVDALDQQRMELVLKRLLNMGNKDLSEQCKNYETLIKEEDGDENYNSLKRPTTRKRMSSDDGRTGRKQMVNGSDIISPTEYRRSSSNTQYSSSIKRVHSQSNGNNIVNNNNNIHNTGSFLERCHISDNKPPRRVEEMVQKSDAKDTLQLSREKVDEPVLEVNNNNTTAKIQFPKNSSQTTSPGSPLNKFRSLEQTTNRDYNKISSPEHSSPSSPSVSRSLKAQYTSNISNCVSEQSKISPPKSLNLSSQSQPIENGYVAMENGHQNGASLSMSPPAPRTSTPLANGVGYHGNHKHSVGAVHSLAEKFQSQNHTPRHPSDQQVNGQVGEDEQNQDGSFAAALSIARKCMIKKIETRDPLDTRKESEIQWEKAIATLNRPLVINDLDFTELEDSDDCDPLKPNFDKSVNGGPPPPPPLGIAPPLPPGGLLNGSSYGMHSPRPPSPSRSDSPNSLNQHAKDLKTVKLFWKEAHTQAPPGVLDKKGGVFWQKVRPVPIDTNKLVYLFETKTNKDVASKKKEDKKSEIRVLDTKRSNAINIGLTKLPPPRAINAAILKFDSSVMNKECIEKILSTMMPTDEEKEKILDSKAANPDIPLGSAEQFLLLLSEIPALLPRLKLWLFMLDYANLEREVAEPLMDLKIALQELEGCRTFQYVLATLLSIGNVLNGIEIKGFQLEFLAKVPEVKDTVNKHSLVYHLGNIVMEKFPDSTDLYTELGAVIRCAKVDFDDVRSVLEKTEVDCKHSWDYLRDLIKHEPANQSKNKISDFLMDAAQRILTLKVIHTRVINRFRKFLIYMGTPAGSVRESKINNICKIVAEFSLEYRTCRDKIVQQRKRLQDKRERNKTRGKLIIETKQWSAAGSNGSPLTNGHSGDGATSMVPGDQKRHCELSKVLKAKTFDDAGCNSYPGARLRTRKSTDDLTSGNSYPSRHSGPPTLDPHDVGDDEILEGLVKAATIHNDQMRERRRARHFNRKSLRRTRTVKLDDDELNAVLQNS